MHHNKTHPYAIKLLKRQIDTTGGGGGSKTKHASAKIKLNVILMNTTAMAFTTVMNTFTETINLFYQGFLKDPS